MPTVECPYCAAKSNVPAEYDGRTTKCVNCGKPVARTTPSKRQPARLSEVARCSKSKSEGPRDPNMPFDGLIGTSPNRHCWTLSEGQSDDDFDETSAVGSG